MASIPKNATQSGLQKVKNATKSKCNIWKNAVRPSVDINDDDDYGIDYEENDGEKELPCHCSFIFMVRHELQDLN